MSFNPCPKKKLCKRLSTEEKKKRNYERKVKQGNRTRNQHIKKAISKYQRWIVIEKYIIKRDGGRCQICGKKHNQEVHHIIPRGRGGTDDERNLITVCWECHRGSSDAIHIKPGGVDYWIPRLQEKII